MSARQDVKPFGLWNERRDTGGGNTRLMNHFARGYNMRNTAKFLQMLPQYPRIIIHNHKTAGHFGKAKTT